MKFPTLKSPSYLEPSGNVNTPLPLRLPFLNSPTYFFPFALVKIPTKN